MKFVKYEIDGETHWGAMEGDDIRRYSGCPFAGGAALGETDPAGRARLLAPVERPRVFGVGLNYVSHVAEAGAKTPEFPMLFMKPDTAVIGPGEDIVYPLEGSEVHFEAELAVVMGKPGRRIGEAEALDHVFGYTCANDISERPIQFAEMATGCLLIGKGYDTFCPVGPVIATDIDPGNAEMRARVNGVERQSINTSDLLFSVPALIAYLSKAITLLPGDVIITGTPAGVGPVVPGDSVEIEIEGVGVLRNGVVAEEGSGL